MDVLKTTDFQQKVRKAIEKTIPGAVYETGYHGPDHTGRFVHDLTFRYGDGHFTVTVKPVKIFNTF